MSGCIHQTKLWLIIFLQQHAPRVRYSMRIVNISHTRRVRHGLISVQLKIKVSTVCLTTTTTKQRRDARKQHRKHKFCSDNHVPPNARCRPLLQVRKADAWTHRVNGYFWNTPAFASTRSHTHTFSQAVMWAVVCAVPKSTMFTLIKRSIRPGCVSDVHVTAATRL